MQDSGQGSVLIKHAVIHMGLLVCEVRTGKGKGSATNLDPGVWLH